MLRVIGLMSGTSLDGVDAAWIETDGEAVRAFGPWLTIAYDGDLRASLRGLLDRSRELRADDPELAAAVRSLTEYHARAALVLGGTPDLIGFHGQTILHDPAARRTWQIGDAALLARMTGAPVVHDFRSADVAAGGQGAPLAPVFHAALARALPRPLAVLNIGGVANVTWIGADDEIIAFDTGPGNGPLDDWVYRHRGERFDRDGALAMAGRADAAVLGRLLAHPYFDEPAPKSLDRLAFADALAASGVEELSPEDGAATLVAFSAGAVAAARLPAPPCRWLVCGGGRRNPAIMAALRASLAGPVEPVEAVGWNGDALEAQCFGFLAARVAAGLPISFPTTTGVPRAMAGGVVTHPDAGERGATVRG
jgi:anhydro-N-acetylmuramic acid kinase